MSTPEELHSLISQQSKLIEAALIDLTSSGMFDPRNYGVGDTPGFWPYPAPYGQQYLDRKGKGENLPAILTEQQLSLLRRRIRALVAGNEIASNAVNQRINYAVGTGLKYEVSKRVDSCPDSLVEETQAVIEAVCDYNELGVIEQEMVRRMDTDGEAMFRVFPRPGGIIALRPVEPEQVADPVGRTDGEWSFGLKNAPGDVTEITHYCIDGVPVEASKIIHLKFPETPLNSKRGLPAFYPIESTLKAVEDLLQSVVTMAKARAKIALLRKLANTTSQLASSLVQAQGAGTVTDAMTDKQFNLEKIPYGSILTLGNSSEVEMPAANVAGADYVTVMSMVLRIIAARFSMPEYLLSSDASNGNFASTLVAEAPFIRAMRSLQDHLARFFARNRYPGHRQSLIWRAISWAVDCGLLPRQVFRLIDVQAVGPSLIVRDNAKEAQVDWMYHDMGVKSIKTIQLEQGLEPDEEAANFREERAAEAASQPAVPPGVNPQIQQPGQEQQQGPGVGVGQPQPTRQFAVPGMPQTPRVQVG